MPYDHPPLGKEEIRILKRWIKAADLIYHLLVALAERGVEPAEVLNVLAERRG